MSENKDAARVVLTVAIVLGALVAAWYVIVRVL